MKKIITLFIAVMLTTLGFAQMAPIDFEAGGNGADWTWNVFENDDDPDLEIVANPDPSGINTSATVAQFTARGAGQPFAGVESMHGSDIGTFDLTAANATLNIMVYKTKISDIGLKFATPSGGAQPELRVANTLINQWEMITIDFSSQIGLGETTGLDQIIIFPDFIDRPADDIIFFDNITFGAQVIGSVGLPVDFELDAGDYTFVGFEGADSLIEANPDMSGENTSATVMRTTKMVGSQFFAGTFLDLDVPIDFSASQSIAVNTWSPKANIPVRLAIENQATGNQIFVDVNTTVTDTWETLVFDFTGLVDAAVDYNRFVIFFEFIVDLPGDGSTYFFDDVEVAGAPMGAPVVLPITFEDANVDYNPIGFEGADSAVEANAVSGGINTSATVLRSTKTEGAQFFAGTAINLGTPIDFNEFEGISLNTYSPKAGIPVKLRLENADNSVGVEVDVNTTVADEWETLTYDFTGLTAGTDFVRIVVFFEFIVDLPGDGSTYYFDDVMVAEPLSVNGFEISTINTFPNPVVDQLNIDAEVAIATISIVNMLGQEVFQSQPEVTNTQLQLAQLKSGMYLVNISDDFGNMKTIKIIKK